MVCDRDGIRSLRADLKLTQAGLAKIMGVQTHTIYMWEAGKQTPSPSAWRLMTLIEEGRVVL